MSVFAKTELAEVRPKIVKAMPPVLCFSDAPAVTLQTLSDLRWSLNRNSRAQRRYDYNPKRHNKSYRNNSVPYTAFETIDTISPAAALVLAAEYERAMDVMGFMPRVVNIQGWKPEVVNILYNLGFFEILGIEEFDDDQDFGDGLSLLRMRSGDTTDSSEVDRLTRELKGLFPGNDDEHGLLLHLFGAMVEAIANTCTHAYPPDVAFRYKHANKWWVTGAVDREKKWMTAIVYDQGMSIPLTLSKWQLHAGWLKRLFNKVGLVSDPGQPIYDGEAIECAVQESVSRIDDPKHGNGLAQMRQFVEHCSDGYLRIMSRCGEVVFLQNGQSIVKTHKTSIGGTLIEWNVSI